MNIYEAKKTLIEHAHKRIIEIDEMHYNVIKFYHNEKKSFKKLIELLEFCI